MSCVIIASGEGSLWGLQYSIETQKPAAFPPAPEWTGAQLYVENDNSTEQKTCSFSL